MCYQNLPSSAFVVVDYTLLGQASATFFGGRRTQLAGVTIALPDRPPRHHDDITGILQTLADRPRLYFDAPLAIALELQHNLPVAPAYGDVRAMLNLLQQPVPSALAQSSDASGGSLARAAEMQRLAPQLDSRIEQEGLDRVYRQIELPVAIPTAVMLSTGLRINQRVLHGIRSNQWSRMEMARRTLRRAAGQDFDPDDAVAVRRLLYRDLGLPSSLETRNGNEAVSKAALAQLQSLHPLVGQLQTYRDAKSAYDSAEAVLGAIDPDTSVVRGDLDPLGTKTGRFSCSNPPLQALDARVRRAVEAAPGNILIEADYSQMELRVLAHFSQDQGLMTAFTHDQDLHRRTAATVLGIAEEAVNEQQRSVGKALNFGIVYGQTAYGLAEELGISIPQAEAFLAADAAAHPGIASWTAAVHQQALNNGEVRTLFGRRRYLPNIFSASPADAAEARRQAVNTIIQGTAADLLKLALIRLHDCLPTEVRMLLPVHDSILLEVPERLVEQTRLILMDAMQMVPAEFTVPLKVDVKAGRTWADCKRGSARVG